MIKKKGAIELSIGTLVIIVIAMAVLIAGLVLVRNIFTGATSTVDELNNKVRGEIVALFSDNERDVVIRLGSDRTARIRPSDEEFGVGLGARTKDGSIIEDRGRLKYKLELDSSESGSCVEIIGASSTKSFFKTPLDKFVNFGDIDGSSAFAIIALEVPKGTQQCSQKVFVDVEDSKTKEFIGGTFFRIEILREGIF
jgi:hypothetical protein